MRTVASWISPKASKGKSSAIEGRGLFAKAEIDAGEVVAVKGGHIVTTETMRSLPLALQNSEIQIDEGLHLVALEDDEYDAVMLFINHSCDPNVGFSGNVVLRAMRDISPGEELTTDYCLFDTPESTMSCSCGSPHCRGTITGEDWRSEELIARYDGWFSAYLADRIRKLGDETPG